MASKKSMETRLANQRKAKRETETQMMRYAGQGAGVVGAALVDTQLTTDDDAEYATVMGMPTNMLIGGVTALAGAFTPKSMRKTRASLLAGGVQQFGIGGYNLLKEMFED